MRPKIVILILMVTVGLIALAAVLKITMQGDAPQQAKVPELPAEEPAAVTPVVSQMKPNSSNTAAMLEQLRATELEKQLDQVRQAQADGADNPQSTALLLRQIMSKEPEVRSAALEALVQLDATNAIPGLEEARGLIEDPDAKAAISQAVEYLKLPSAMDGSPPPPEITAAQNPNAQVPWVRPIRTNPAFLRGEKKSKQTTAAPGTSTVQPAAPAYPAQPQAQPDAPPQ